MAFQEAFNLTKAYILRHVTEEEIFFKYLGFYPNFKRKFCNTLRDDTHPGCGFQVSGGKIQFFDWSRRFNEDCFGVARIATRSKDYNETLRNIARDFGLLDEKGNPTYQRVYSLENRTSYTLDGVTVKTRKEEVFIEPYQRDWTKNDIRYWKGYYLSSRILELYEVSSISGYYLCNPNTDNEIYLSFYDYQLAFSYHCKGHYKIYQPYSKSSKWVNNIPHKYYQGYPQLPERGDYCIITKSKKDVMCMHRMGIPAVAPQAESSVISENGYHLLINRFPRLLSLYDFDRSGCRGAFIMRDKFGITPLFLTNGRYRTINYRAKDFSDFLKVNGLAKTEYLIKTTIDHLTYQDNERKREDTFYPGTG